MPPAPADIEQAAGGPGRFRQGPVRRRRTNHLRRLGGPDDAPPASRTARPWRACAAPAPPSSGAPTWSSLPSRASAPTRTLAPPPTPCSTDVPRIPGGSSSGAGVSVATGAAFIGLGSRHRRLHPHPGRSERHCWLQKHRPPGADRGALPLSTTLDTVCAMTRTCVTRSWPTSCWPSAR